MTISERREREKQALKAEILAAARDLFVEHGFENVSMRRVAERIDYSPAAIYLYFRDKSELLYSICEETFQKLTVTLNTLVDRARERNADPVDTLRRGLRAYVAFGLEHPNHYIVTFLTRHPKEQEGAYTLGLEAFSCLRRSVEACVTAKKFREGDIEEMSQALWAAVHGVTALLIQCEGFPFVSKKKLIGRTIDSMIDGLTRTRG